MDPYQVLGIEPDATAAQIKTAYRSMSALTHPDKTGGSAEDFRAIKEAYDILSNPDRKARYDATGKTRPSPITPDRMIQTYRQIMKQVVAAIDADNPERDNIQLKMMNSLKKERGAVQDKLFNAQRRLERATRLSERFDAKGGFDPVGIALALEKQEIQEEVNLQEDMMEVSLELERILKTYTYNVDPQPEGQHSWGPTTVQVFQLGGFSSSSSTGG